MNIQPQHSAAILECDFPITDRERRRILSELQAMGFRAYMLPMGVTVAAVAAGDLEGEGDDE